MSLLTTNPIVSIAMLYLICNSKFKDFQYLLSSIVFIYCIIQLLLIKKTSILDENNATYFCNLKLVITSNY